MFLTAGALQTMNNDSSPKSDLNPTNKGKQLSVCGKHAHYGRYTLQDTSTRSYRRFCQEQHTMADPERTAWAAFLSWESRACRAVDLRNSLEQLKDELREQWDSMTNRTEYVEALREVQETQHEIQRQYQLLPTADEDDIEAQRHLEEALQQLLDLQRTLMAQLQVLLHEQEVMNSLHRPRWE